MVRLESTNAYVAKKNTIIEHAEQIREQRRRMQSSMLEKKKDVRTDRAVKAVPKVVVSAKFIMADKKNLTVLDQDGQEISMDELQKRSKEGGAGKGRK